MAFIIEKIAEEDRFKIDWAQFPESLRPLGYPRFVRRPIIWVIDRDRNVLFWVVETPSPETQYYQFALIFKDQLIVMNAMLTFKDYPKIEHKQSDLYWSVFSIVIPELLNIQRATILDLIREVLKVYGLRGLDGLSGDVFVTFR